MKANCIVACGTANYLWPAAVTMKRMKAAIGQDADALLFLIDGTEPDAALMDFCGSDIEIGQLDMSDFRFDHHYRDNLNVTVFGRLFAFRQLVQHYRQIFYVDCDTLFVGGPLAEIFAAGTDGAAIAAVRDGSMWSGKLSRSNRAYLSGLGIAPDRYFNSGVLLIDSEAARRSDMVDACFRVLHDQPDICKMHDQSALNHACKGHWKDLSPRWNWQFGYQNLAAVWQQFAPHLVHFTGRTKPWSDPLRKLPSELRDPFLAVPQIRQMAGEHPASQPAQPIDKRMFTRYYHTQIKSRPQLAHWARETDTYFQTHVWGAN